MGRNSCSAKKKKEDWSASNKWLLTSDGAVAAPPILFLLSVFFSFQNVLFFFVSRFSHFFCGSGYRSSRALWLLLFLSFFLLFIYFFFVFLFLLVFMFRKCVCRAGGSILSVGVGLQKDKKKSKDKKKIPQNKKGRSSPGINNSFRLCGMRSVSDSVDMWPADTILNKSSFKRCKKKKPIQRLQKETKRQ